MEVGRLGAQSQPSHTEPPLAVQAPWPAWGTCQLTKH